MHWFSSVHAVHLSVELTKERYIFTTTWSRRRPSVLTEYTTNLVKEFTTSQGLTLNIDKCEAVISPSTPANVTHIEAGQLQIPLSNSARCLGAWWSPSLSCKKWNNLEKARRAFFARGSGVFHGRLNPLSSMNIIEHCVLPCLLYGAESWILDNSLLAKLESFQAELAKRILRLKKKHRQQHSPYGSPMSIHESSHSHNKAQLSAKSHHR